MKVNVCIVTFPLSEAGYTPLSNIVRLFGNLSNRFYVISGGEALEKLENSKLDVSVKTMKVTHRASPYLLIRIINYVHTELKILRFVIVASRGSDLFVFSIGGESLILPMLFLKLLRKKVLLMPGGVVTKGYSVRGDPLSRLTSLLASINFFLADRIVIYSPALIKELNMNQRNKIAVAHEHFIDFTKFVVKRKNDERPNIVGYMGRFSEEKGILNLVKAFPLVSKHRKDVHFMLCGEGKLSDEIRNIIQHEGLAACTKLTGWVSHEDVPNYLTDFKLLVLPSYTEGLPNVVLEAMACGTPVLATQVGAIPDVIRDGETGFLLDSNDSNHIADKIAELLGKPELLEKVSVNAYKYIREAFSYEKNLEAWQKILNELGLSKKSVLSSAVMQSRE